MKCLVSRIGSDILRRENRHCRGGLAKLQHVITMKESETEVAETKFKVKAGLTRKGRGQGRSSEFEIWLAMRNRCYRKTHQNYHRYGGRGISVCERWRTSFANFLQDMGPRPTEKHSLDRFPNNDGNYEPGNCRWGTKTEQASNTSKTKLFEINGERNTVPEWSRISGTHKATISYRISEGRSVHEAVWGGRHSIPRRPRITKSA